MRGRWRAADALFAIAVIVTIGAFLWLARLRADEPLALDQGLFACFGRWIPQGRLPYRDIFDSKPPLYLYTWVLAYAIGGVSHIWRLEILWLAATGALAFELGRRLWGRFAGLAAATFLLVGLWTPAFGGYWSRAQAEELAALPIVLAAFFALAARQRPRLALVAGVLTGIVGLYKIPCMAVGGAWLLAWWLPSAQRTPRSGALARTGWFAVGVALPWMLTLAFFAAHGALGDFVQAVFVYQRYIAEFISPPWESTLRDFAATVLREIPLPLLASFVGLVALFRRRAPEAPLLLAWVLLPMGAVLLQRQLAGYHYLALAPGLALAGGCGVAELGLLLAAPRLGARAIGGIGFLALALLGWRAGPVWRNALEADLAYRHGELPHDRYLQRFRAGSFSPATEALAAKYLREHSAPTDGLLVWATSPGIYVLADRHPVTRYPFHKILMTRAPLSLMISGLEERRAELLARLRADPPAYILVGTRDQNGFEPTDSMSSLQEFEELAELVNASYQQEVTIGRMIAYRRR